MVDFGARGRGFWVCSVEFGGFSVCCGTVFEVLDPTWLILEPLGGVFKFVRSSLEVSVSVVGPFSFDYHVSDTVFETRTKNNAIS